MKLNWNKLRRECVLMKERGRLLMGENTSRQCNYQSPLKLDRPTHDIGRVQRKVYYYNDGICASVCELDQMTLAIPIIQRCSRILLFYSIYQVQLSCLPKLSAQCLSPDPSATFSRIDKSFSLDFIKHWKQLLNFYCFLNRFQIGKNCSHSTVL